MLKAIFHPEHRTAHSIKTCGATIYGVNRLGEIVWEGASQKQACFWSVPSETVIFVHLYTSNSGRPYIIAYDAQDHLPGLFAIDASQPPERLQRGFEGVGIPANSEIVRVAMEFLYPAYGGW